MYKRMSIRIVSSLAESLREMAKKRGLSVNSLITEMAWDFVDEWKQREKDRGSTDARAGQADHPAPAALSDDIVIFN